MFFSKLNYIKKFGEYSLLFNTLSRKVLRFKTELLEGYLQDGIDVEFLGKERIQAMKENGFITDKPSLHDEYLDWYKAKRDVFEKRLNIYFTPTTRCNLHCDYCFENHIQRGDMNEETFQHFLSLLEEKLKNDSKIEQFNLTLFGGEPLLRNDYNLRLLEATKKICEKRQIKMDVLMTTNGVIDDEEKLAALAKSGVNRVQITLDGSEKINNLRRKNRNFNVYRKVLDNLKLYTKYFYVVIKFNFDQGNLTTANELIDDLLVLGLDQKSYRVKSEAIQITANDYHEMVEPNTFKMADAFLNLMEQLEQKQIVHDFMAVFPTPCMVASPNSYLVEPGGSISSCISAFEIDYFRLGRVQELSDLNFDANRFSKEKVVLSHCISKECPFLAICETGCALEHYHYKIDMQCKMDFYEYFLNQYLERVERQICANLKR